MGDMAEYYMEMGFEEEVLEEMRHREIEDALKEMDRLYSFGVLKWKTKNDGYVMVSKMTKEHLENTILFIHKNKKNKKNEIAQKWMELLKIELMKRE